MYLVCKNLKIDKEKTTKYLIRTVEKVLSNDTASIDKNVFYNKIEEIQQKHTNLIELYINNEIDHNEFIALRTKYDMEIKNLRSIIESTKQNQDNISNISNRKNQKEQIEEIKSVIEELVCGIEYEDEFYAQLLDKIVIGNKDNKDNIEVYLKYLPFPWCYTSIKK